MRSDRVKRGQPGCKFEVLWRFLNQNKKNTAFPFSFYKALTPRSFEVKVVKEMPIIYIWLYLAKICFIGNFLGDLEAFFIPKAFWNQIFKQTSYYPNISEATSKSVYCFFKFLTCKVFVTISESLANDIRSFLPSGAQKYRFRHFASFILELRSRSIRSSIQAKMSIWTTKKKTNQ